MLRKLHVAAAFQPEPLPPDARFKVRSHPVSAVTMNRDTGHRELAREYVQMSPVEREKAGSSEP